jgi:hypothetical protein
VAMVRHYPCREFVAQCSMAAPFREAGKRELHTHA